jgi:ankyrin repeat protein
MKVLIAKGADAHFRNIYGQTALHFSARGGHVDAFQFLIDLGLDPASTDAKGDNVLCYAASGGCVKIIGALLDKTSNHHHQTTHWDLLHWACRAGKSEVVELMIKEGCYSKSVVLSQLEGQWSPLALALFHGNEEMLNRLSLPTRCQRGAEANTTRLRGESHGGYGCNGCLNVSKYYKCPRIN